MNHLIMTDNKRWCEHIIWNGKDYVERFSNATWGLLIVQDNYNFCPVCGKSRPCLVDKEQGE